jgi:circadian clock protein KaiB
MHRNGQKGTGDTTAEALERLAADSKDQRYVLRLNVAGLTPRSTLAVERIKAICERHLTRRYDLTVIDLYQKPHLARQAQVVGAPTLVKESPLPQRRIIGDMADKSRVLRGLDVQPGEDHDKSEGS